MRKIITLFLLLISFTTFSQIKENIVRMKTWTTAFTEPYTVNQRIRVETDSAEYILTHATTIGQSMNVARTNGWIRKISDPKLPAGAITKIAVVGTNPGTNLTATEWINNVFYAFIPATITLSGGGVYEVGTNNNVTLTASISPYSETSFLGGYINKLTPLPAVEIKSWLENIVTPQSVAVTFYPIKGQTDSLTKTFKAYELVGGNGTPTTISSSTATLSSVYPYLYGMSDLDLTGGGSALYVAMTKSVKACASSTSVIYNSPTLQYAYFAFPATCGNITMIKDQNNYDWTNAFTLYPNVNVNSLYLDTDWFNTPYKIYRSNNKFSTVGDWTFTITQ